MQIPFSPPFIDEDVVREVNEVLLSGWITTGPKVLQLETAVAGFCGVEKALAINSATSAMMLVLHWFGVSEGDEVIIPAYTYCATALAVIHAGAKPVMVDVDDDFNINPQKIKEAITSKTKAVITVDVGGWPCKYNDVYAIINDEAAKAKFTPRSVIQEKLGRILLMADAAHAFGAIYKNAAAGTQADISVFSFHAVKNITTAEGGVICFNMPQPFDNYEIYNTLRVWSLNGQTKDAYTKSANGMWRYDIVYTGFKMNMPDVLAAIALAQLRKYQHVVLPKRKQLFHQYTSFLRQFEWAICPTYKNADSESSCHIYLLRIKDITEEQRNSIIEHIAKKKIAVNVHFIPLPMLSVFKNMGYAMEEYPQAYKQYCNEISLPVYPQLSEEACNCVLQAVYEAVKLIAQYE